MISFSIVKHLNGFIVIEFLHNNWTMNAIVPKKVMTCIKMYQNNWIQFYGNKSCIMCNIHVSVTTANKLRNEDEKEISF